MIFPCAFEPHFKSTNHRCHIRDSTEHTSIFHQSCIMFWVFPSGDSHVHFQCEIRESAVTHAYNTALFFHTRYKTNSLTAMVIPSRPYMSNIPTNLCTALLNFLLFEFVPYCYVFVQYGYLKWIQHNAMYKFVRLLDNLRLDQAKSCFQPYATISSLAPPVCHIFITAATQVYYFLLASLRSNLANTFIRSEANFSIQAVLQPSLRPIQCTSLPCCVVNRGISTPYPPFFSRF